MLGTICEHVKDNKTNVFKVRKRRIHATNWKGFGYQYQQIRMVLSNGTNDPYTVVR